ncbi:MAG: glucose-1-phosphate cytidylyltransferase [Atopobiaceae bacterium]|nr:glucose-1-phosphate cytidylyltransferase [Atopobiaceae bacterium]
MKVVILAGGFGSRISEESHLRPKPMIEIGGAPILWHIMKGYSHFGFNEFVICAGYKQHMIKEYFDDFYLHASDVSYDFTAGEKKVTVHNTNVEPWKVTVADTGLETMTAGRINRVHKYLDDEPFLLTYGDGVSDLDPNDLIAFHKKAGGVVTLTAVHARQRFGVLDIDRNGQVGDFREKRDRDESYINGGFMCCEPEVFDYFGQNGANPDGEDFSGVTLEALAADDNLTAYRYDGFWRCMDTQRDREQLEHLWESEKAPWKVW